MDETQANFQELNAQMTQVSQAFAKIGDRLQVPRDRLPSVLISVSYMQLGRHSTDATCGCRARRASASAHWRRPQSSATCRSLPPARTTCRSCPSCSSAMSAWQRQRYAAQQGKWLACLQAVPCHAMAADQWHASKIDEPDAQGSALARVLCSQLRHFRPSSFHQRASSIGCSLGCW